MNIRPTVSIVCLTYNEELYVRDAFDSFLAQETTFPFEVLVYDDASQDETPNIIKEYSEKYPDVFKVTLYEENNFKKGLGFLGLREGFREARGQYIAYCEGDDYWCDNHKLQKQVDFLEAHPEFWTCVHETKIRNDYYKDQDGMFFTNFPVNLFLDRARQNVYTLADTFTGNIFHVSSMVFRRMDFQWPSWICSVKAMDMVCFMLMAEKGDVYFMRDVMSVYRSRTNSITSTPTGDFKNAVTFYDASVRILRLMNRYWDRKYQSLIYPIISRYYMRSMFVCLSKSGRNYTLAKEMAKKARAYDPKTYYKYLIIESWNKMKKHLWKK